MLARPKNKASMEKPGLKLLLAALLLPLAAMASGLEAPVTDTENDLHGAISPAEPEPLPLPGLMDEKESAPAIEREHRSPELTSPAEPSGQPANLEQYPVSAAVVEELSPVQSAAQSREQELQSSQPEENPVSKQLPPTKKQSLPEPAPSFVDPSTPPPNWLDKSHSYVSDNGDALAEWLDSFFGTRQSDIESAHSLLRVALIYEADEDKDDEVKVKVRGKIQLPRLSKRFSLIFTGEDDDDNDPIADTVDENTDNQVGLQYQLKENRRSSYDAFFTVNSSIKYKTGVRYRYNYAPTEKFYTRFIQEFAYQQEDKAGSQTRLDLNYLMAENRLLRWRNRVLYGQETEGAEWRTQVSWQQRLAPTKAMTYSVGMNGITDPTRLIKSYGPGVRYRQNVFREYLFFDIVTGYGWRKTDPDSSRKGAWSFEIQLEMFFEDLKKKKKRRKKN